MTTHDDCPDCPLLAVNRRAFLRHAALAAAGALVAAGARPGAAFADTVRAIAPTGVGTGRTLSYAIPASDGVAVDAGNDVVLARWHSRVYAFSLRCPHRGARLEWHAQEQRLFCPRHKARFRPDGAHDSGRRTRALDRYVARRQGTQLVVDLGDVLQEDADAPRWEAAAVTLA